MTRDDVRERVKGEAARRVKEVRRLALVVSTMEHDLAARPPMMRACVVLFHGHLEGFVKNSSRAFLEFMEREKIIPLQLSGKWLMKERFDAGVLFDVVHFLRLSAEPFRTKREYLGKVKRWRDRIAHGEDIHEDVQFQDSDISEMAKVISEVIESFGGQIIESVDDARRK